MTSSFEKPKLNESFWSTSVTRTSSASVSESRVASSRPAKPAPRIRTCRLATPGYDGPSRQIRQEVRDMRRLAVALVAAGALAVALPSSSAAHLFDHHFSVLSKTTSFKKTGNHGFEFTDVLLNKFNTFNRVG